MEKEVGQIDTLWQPWENAYNSFWSNFEDDFKTDKTFSRIKAYVRGLCSSVDRKNSWQLAEFIGENDPYGIQNLLYRASWDVEKTCGKLIIAAGKYLLKPDEQGVLIVDETGFLKKGKHSAGVQRQYSGTAGRIENSQIGVFLALAGSLGRTLIDSRLYLPKEWCEDVPRREAAGIPDEIAFQTKQQLAQSMLSKAFSLGLRPEWVLADAAYGDDSKFRTFLRENNQPYVVAISKNQRIWHQFKQVRVDKYIQMNCEGNWQTLPAGDGTKGLRLYEWFGMKLGQEAEHGMSKFLLCRKKGAGETEKLAYYYCYAPSETTLDDLAQAAGKRWNIECCFETAKQEVGMDEYEVRSWQGWYRHITLSLLALLLLNIFRGLGNPVLGEKKGRAG